MSYSITQCKADLIAALHGTTSNKIQNFDGLLNRAARQLLQDIDPAETIRTVLLANPVYNSVYDYALPVDVKSNRIIDIKPQVNRQAFDIQIQTYNQAFDTSKGNFLSQEQFTINFNTGTKSIRINNPNLQSPTILDQMNAVGNWTATSGASNLAIDNVNYESGSGSLKFNLDAGSATGYISETLSTAIDLTAQVNQSSLFAYVYLPSATAVTSVALTWGNDSSNYNTRTVTTTHEGTAFVQGWNLLRFDWNGSTSAGSPTGSISYLKVLFNYDSTLQTAVRVDCISSIMGTYEQIEYYSKYLFRDSSTGAFQETVTDDSNLINLDTDSYNLFFNLAGFLAVQQIQGMDAALYDSNFFGQEYVKGLQRYTAINKSQVQKPHQTYYQKPNPGYGQYLGRRYY